MKARVLGFWSLSQLTSSWVFGSSFHSASEKETGQEIGQKVPLSEWSCHMSKIHSLSLSLSGSGRASVGPLVSLSDHGSPDLGCASPPMGHFAHIHSQVWSLFTLPGGLLGPLFWPAVDLYLLICPLTDSALLFSPGQWGSSRIVELLLESSTLKILSECLKCGLHFILVSVW